MIRAWLNLDPERFHSEYGWHLYVWDTETSHTYIVRGRDKRQETCGYNSPASINTWLLSAGDRVKEVTDVYIDRGL